MAESLIDFGAPADAAPRPAPSPGKSLIDFGTPAAAPAAAPRHQGQSLINFGAPAAAGGGRSLVDFGNPQPIPARGGAQGLTGPRVAPDRPAAPAGRPLVDFNKPPAPSPTIGGTLSDIGGGMLEAPGQIIGGARDAIQEANEAAFSLGSWLNENVADLGSVTFDGDGINWSSGVDTATPGTLPTVGEADTTTGGLVRGVSQFLTGFIPAAKALKVGGAATALGNFGRAAAAGAAADATVFDPQEARLSNLVQEYPELQNPVTAYLAAAPGDTEAEGRLKNALEGLGLGTAAEGMFQAVRTISRLKRSKGGATATPDGQATPATPADAPEAGLARPAASEGETAARVFQPGQKVRISDPGSPVDGVLATVTAKSDRGYSVRLPDGREFSAGKFVLDAVDDATAATARDGYVDTPAQPAAGGPLSQRLTGAPGAKPGAPSPMVQRLTGGAPVQPAGRLSQRLTTGPNLPPRESMAGMSSDRLQALGRNDPAMRELVDVENKGRVVQPETPDGAADQFADAPPTRDQNLRMGLEAFDRATQGETVRGAMIREDLGPVAFDFGTLDRLPPEQVAELRKRLPIVLQHAKASGNPANGRVKLNAGNYTVDLRRVPMNGRETWRVDAVTIDGKRTPLARPDVQRVEGGDLPTYKVKTDKGGVVNWRGPLDLISWARSKGGLWDYKGELNAIGLNSKKPRSIAPRERFLGPVVRGTMDAKRDAQLGLSGVGGPAKPDRGLTLDDAAEAAWEAGYFGARDDRPTINEFLELLDKAARADNIADSALTEADRLALDQVRTRPDYDEMAYQMGLDTSGLADDAVSDAVLSEQQRFIGGDVSEAGVYESAPPVGDPISGQGREAVEAMTAGTSQKPVPGERAGNIRMDKLESPEDIRAALKTASDQNAAFGGARRGVVSDDALSALADDLGMSVDVLKTRRVGQSYNAEELFAARRLLAQSGEDLVRLSKAARGGSDEALAAFQRAWTRHVAIQEQVSGATAEAGRALRQFRLTAQTERQRMEAIKQLADMKGGRDRIEDLADKLAALDDPAAINKLSRKAYEGGLFGKLNEYWINALLSGPQTHIVNITSNALTQLYSIPEEILAAGFGAVRGGQDKVFMRESAQRAFGMVEGARDAVRATAKAIRTGEGFDATYSKLGEAYPDAIGGTLGKVVRVPTRALEVEDTFFKTLAFRTELNALATRQAIRDGAKGPDFARKVAEYKANPTDEMTDQAIQRARVLTFTNPLGPAGSAISRLRTVPGFKWVVPFIKTPTNILKFAARRSPVAPIMREVREDVAAGGARRDRALAQIAMGSAMGLAAYSYAREGLITGGGPSDWKEKQALMATGWQPYSMKIGDKWYSFDRLDPLGLTIGVAADMAEVMDKAGETEASELAAGLAMSFVSTLKDKSYLRGISDAMTAIDDPDRYAGRWARNMGASFIPNFIGQYTRASDPYLRENRTFVEAVKARLPGYSDTLFPKRDVWGEPIKRTAGALGDGTAGRLFSPVRGAPDQRDMVTSELIRLDLVPSKAPRKMSGVELTPAQYDTYQQLTGRLSRRIMDRFMGGPLYERMPDPARRMLAETLMRTARQTARTMLGQQFPELRALAEREKAGALLEGRKRETVQQ